MEVHGKMVETSKERKLFPVFLIFIVNHEQNTLKDHTMIIRV